MAFVSLRVNSAKFPSLQLLSDSFIFVEEYVLLSFPLMHTCFLGIYLGTHRTDELKLVWLILHFGGFVIF